MNLYARLILLLILMCHLGSQAQELNVPDPENEYARYRKIEINTHCHTSDSDAVGPDSNPTQIIQQNLARLDGLFLTDHAEHLNQQEWNRQLNLAQMYVFEKLCLRGLEITGTAEVQTNVGKNPAYQHGWGHLIVIGTSNFAGRNILGDGSPPEILPTFKLFKTWLVQNNGLAIFAHPSLYMIEESFDGFAPPASEAEIEQFVGCELSSHGARYAGLGDGKTLHSSNEACYRTLLRRGWKVSPYMGGDEHHPPFGKTNTVTGMFVKNQTSEGILEAMRSRRTFATEEPGAVIQLVALSNDKTAIMGETLSLNKELTIHVRCTSNHDRVSQLSLVFISSKGDFYDVIQNSQALQGIDEHWGTIVSQKDLGERDILLVYAKAALKNGHNLVSSPIWLNTR